MQFAVRHFGRFLLTTALLQTVSIFLFLTLLTFALGWLATPRLTPPDVIVAVCFVGCAAFVYLLGFTLTDVSRIQLLRRGEAPFWVGIADGLEALTRRPLALLSVSARTGLLTATASLTAPALATWMALAAPGTWGDLGAWVVAQVGAASVILIRVWGWNHLLSRLPPRSGLLDSSPTPPNRGA